MATDNAALLVEAHDLVERAMHLILAADETLAAAELEQALQTIRDRLAADGRLNSGSALGRSSAIQ